MSVDATFLKKAIGRSVLDPYGRLFGRVVGYCADEGGRILRVGVERSNGEILSYPSSQFLVKNGSLVFVYSWKILSEKFIKQFNAISRKIWALDKLYEKGELSQDYYEGARKGLEKSLTVIMERRRKLLKLLKCKIDKLMVQIDDIEKYLVSAKMDYVTEELNEEDYKSITRVLEVGLEKIVLEKNDVENLINIIERTPKIPRGRRVNSTIPVPPDPTSPLVLHLEGDKNSIKSLREGR